jgi:hypothetical protein
VSSPRLVSQDLQQDAVDCATQVSQEPGATIHSRREIRCNATPPILNAERFSPETASGSARRVSMPRVHLPKSWRCHKAGNVVTCAPVRASHAWTSGFPGTTSSCESNAAQVFDFAQKMWRGGCFEVLGARAPIAVDPLPPRPPPIHPADLTGAGVVRVRRCEATPRARLPPPFWARARPPQSPFGTQRLGRRNERHSCPLVGLVGMDDYAAVDSSNEQHTPGSGATGFFHRVAPVHPRLTLAPRRRASSSHFAVDVRSTPRFGVPLPWKEGICGMKTWPSLPTGGGSSAVLLRRLLPGSSAQLTHT